MNPFTGSLNRVGYLVWSILLILWVIGFGVLIDATKAQHVGVYWLGFRILWMLVLIALSLLVPMRRIQNAGLSLWLVLVMIVPFASMIFWFALFFIPPGNHEVISPTASGPPKIPTATT
jgi:uncharacterized membrane protein YhaH (DUF805 family)